MSRFARLAMLFRQSVPNHIGGPSIMPLANTVDVDKPTVGSVVVALLQDQPDALLPALVLNVSDDGWTIYAAVVADDRRHGLALVPATLHYGTADDAAGAWQWPADPQ